MRVTFILKDLTDTFFEGTGDGRIVGLNNMSDADKFSYLNKRHIDLKMPMKVGSGAFRDKVELNQLLRSPKSIQYKLEPRKGYRLATFDIT